MAEPKKVYWDSCVWLSLINNQAGRVERCQYQIGLAKRGEIQIWTSSLTLAEVFKRKCDGENVLLAEASDVTFEQFIEQEFLVEVQVDHEIGVTARRLLRVHQALKKPADAIHLATAALYNVDELHTFDGDNLLALNGQIQRRDGSKLTICEPPPIPVDPQLGLFGAPAQE